MIGSIDVIANGVVCYDQSLLLTRRAGWDFWTLPGDSVKPGEPIEEALKRTLQTTLRTSLHRHDLSSVVESMESADGRPNHELHFLFDVELDVPAQDGADSDIETRWFWWGDIDSVDIRPVVLADQVRDPVLEQRVWIPATGSANETAKSQRRSS